MSKPTKRMQAQRLMELTIKREQARETLNDQRRFVASLDREIRKIAIAAK